ncbi:hypothetical protein ACFQ7F_23925 [Streptomyces sp. NPDC056486]|uniref:hypothetical protein n=1 Tax=Streptomyces sp. NPDC056486 TaxID=3345835 RepID=UPI0036BA5889
MAAPDSAPAQAWHPEPGETLLARIPVAFATGAATPVSGMRWFRDDERRDIQGELVGWPEGPAYTARSQASRLARRGLKAGLLVTLIAVVGALGGTGVGNVSTLGRSADPEDEVEDFPVLWAAPGTLARTLPWQLDPARRPDTDRTHAIITDRRLVIVGLLDDSETIWDDVLWEAPRSAVDRVEPRDFNAAAGGDVKVVFTDGSWCRLTSRWRDEFVDHLGELREIVGLGSLTTAQRMTVMTFAAAHSAAGTPLVTRRPDGDFLIAIRSSDRVSPSHGLCEGLRDMVMGPDGGEIKDPRMASSLTPPRNSTATATATATSPMETPPSRQ